MSLQAELQPLLLPSGTEFPGTPQDLLELIAQYMSITGLNPFNGINYGPTTPDAENRDRPWFKTTSQGFPVGWFSWSGSVWSPIPLTTPSGPSTSRPDKATEGVQYFDTTINCALVFNRGQWRTLAGSTGDVKFVKASTIEAALVLNPGWTQDPSSPGRAIGAAGSGDGLTPRAYGDTAGAENVTLSADQMPDHNHAYQQRSAPRWQADGNAAAANGNLVGYSATMEDATTSNAGGSTAVPTISPIIFYWALVKL